MKNNAVQIVLGVVVLVALGAIEELAPSIGHVGFPFLLSAVVYASVHTPPAAALGFAAAAGAMEDALSGLPLMTSVSLFVAVAAFVKWADLPRVGMAMAYPIYQIWLAIWLPRYADDVFLRVLLALPIGLLTVSVTSVGLVFLTRKAGCDDVA